MLWAGHEHFCRMGHAAAESRPGRARTSIDMVNACVEAGGDMRESHRVSREPALGNSLTATDVEAREWLTGRA